MAQLVKHLKQSIIADGPDPNQVNPSDWNASHVFSGGALGGLLVRDTGDATYGASWLASVAAGNVLISNGVGALPTWASSLTLGGSLTVTGALTVNAGLVTVQWASPNDTQMVIRNTQAGATARTTLLIGNDTLGYLTALVSNSSTIGTSLWPLSVPNGSEVHAFGAGGLTLSCDTAAPLRFVTSNVVRMQVTGAGELLVNQSGDVGGGMLAIGCDGTAHTGIAIQDLAAANNATFIFFINSVNGGAGYIGHTGATTVAYNTSSDARLKDDAGRATDVAALRAVVVHDFTWKADGVRARGVFAQEAYDVFPLAISKGTDERTARGDLTHPWMTDYSKFVPDLIVGWQQLDAEVAALRAELATLKG